MIHNIKNPKHIEHTMDGKKHWSKRKKIFVIILSSTLAFMLSVTIFIWLLLTGGFPTKTSNIKDYGTFKDFKGYSNLYIFPTQMPDSAQIDSYYYYYRDTIFDPTCQIYLEYSLSKEDYEKEVLRLSKISESFEYKDFETKATQNTIAPDTNNFIYPAYVTILNNNHCNEYALLNEEENKIICVFTQFINSDDVKFDKKYLPKDYENKDKTNGFNMYYTSLEDGIKAFERHNR